LRDIERGWALKLSILIAIRKRAKLPIDVVVVVDSDVKKP
jgi:hypothetical protein